MFHFYYLMITKKVNFKSCTLVFFLFRKKVNPFPAIQVLSLSLNLLEGCNLNLHCSYFFANILHRFCSQVNENIKQDLKVLICFCYCYNFLYRSPIVVNAGKIMAIIGIFMLSAPLQPSWLSQ